MKKKFGAELLDDRKHEVIEVGALFAQAKTLKDWGIMTLDEVTELYGGKVNAIRRDLGLPSLSAEATKKLFEERPR